ncbi:MAG: HDIG domain-containing protein [Lentisphaerae bacterium]|nr:HDIG domain-containing protein [Lentisphaerota bacterium]
MWGPLDEPYLFAWLGKSVLLLISLCTAIFGLMIIRPGTLSKSSNVLLLALVALVALVPVKLILYFTEQTQAFSSDLLPFLFPLPLAPILATLLLDGTAGIAVGIWTSLAVSLYAGGGLPLFLGGLVATITSAAMGHRARTRTKVVRTGLVAGLAEVTCVFGLTALNASHSDVMTVLNQAGACLCSGFLAAVLALLILPLFESAFRITSDITLLELSDLSHPLLQRLALEAPGTYHHSLVVANLAQAAADEIGANSLQTRVCAYFHDIGKLSKPEFFTENIRINHNPHDRLAPSMSTLVITSHVKEGVSLALLYKLPKAVIDVIREHHGTSLVSYFHDKAKAQLEFEMASGGSASDQSEVPEWNFRYGGPRPATAESAIIGLADPVEAASRSIEKVTPSHIAELVDTIVNVRLEDGQLDESPLTLEQLARIKKSFVFTLTNMLHARTPYPRDEDRDKQSTRPSASGRPEVGLPDDVFHG